MNDKVTVSLLKIFEMFPDEQTARKYLEARIWPDGPVCPFCSNKKVFVLNKPGFYRCKFCKGNGGKVSDFTVRSSTIFDRSHIPLHKWLYAIYLLLTARKGISSLQLSKIIDITQKSAWFMLHRLREACGNDLESLKGIVEIDETYIGGKEKNKHKSKRLLSGRGTLGKTPVIGMREREGRTFAQPLPNVAIPTIQESVRKNIAPGSEIHTDELTAYQGMPEYTHKFVTHSAKEFVKDGVTTNGIESAWSVLKRGITGVYHHASEKHLARYANEFTFRLNDGNVKRQTLDRMTSLIKATVGKGITFKKLTS